MGIPQASSHIFQRDPMDMQGNTSHLQCLLFSAILSNLVLRVFFSLLCKLNATRNSQKFRYIRNKWPISGQSRGILTGFLQHDATRSFCTPPGWDACQLQGYHKHWFPRNPFIHLVKRGTERVKCLAQQHNAQSPLPGFEPGPLDPETSAITMRPPCLTRLGLQITDIRTEIKTPTTRLLFVILACAIQPVVRYFRKSNQNFPGSHVLWPLVKGNEHLRYDIIAFLSTKTKQRRLCKS